MADNTWHRTLCGIGVSEWDGKGGDPAPRDCGQCADAPQPAPPAQPDPVALRAVLLAFLDWLQARYANHHGEALALLTNDEVVDLYIATRAAAGGGK